MLGTANTIESTWLPYQWMFRIQRSAKRVEKVKVMKRRINANTQLLDKILKFLLHGLERSGGEISSPGKESPNFFSQIAFQPNRKRKTLLISRTPGIGRDRALIFSGGHFLRVFTARWLGLDAACGRYFLLGTASLSALGYEHNLSEPVIRLWDDTRHVVS